MIGVDGVEDGIHSGGVACALGASVGAGLVVGGGTDFVGGEFAVVVDVGSGEEALETVGNFVLREDAVAVFIERHETIYGFVGLVGAGVGLAGEIFERGELAVMVEVEGEEAGTGSGDFGDREFAVMVGVDGEHGRA